MSEEVRPWKDYSNPLYDVVENPQDWVAGLCCIFANALRERFDLPMQAIMVQSDFDGSLTLVHAFGCMPDDRKVDARGFHSEAEIFALYEDYTEADWRGVACLKPGEPYRVVIRDVQLDDLWDLNPEDHEATNAAHRFIDEHRERFAELHALHENRTASKLFVSQP